MTTSSYYQILASVAVVATATFAIIFLTAGTTTGGISILSLRGNSVQEDQESRQLQVHPVRLVAPLDIDPKTVVLKSDQQLPEFPSIQLLSDAEPSMAYTSANFNICGRTTQTFAPNEYLPPSLLNKVASCPQNHELDPNVPTLVLGSSDDGPQYGRTGNQLSSVFGAFEYTRDNNFQLAIVYNSWAMKLILGMFFADNTGEYNDEWQLHVEQALCIKIIREPKTELEGYQIVSGQSPKDLFLYEESYDFHNEERVALKLYTLRTLFQNINSESMCLGIDSVFGEGDADISSVKYSVVHMRNVFRPFWTVADTRAARDMEPDYVKSILEPLDMLQHPIVIMTDHTNERAVARLVNDPVIGPMIHVLTKENSSLGGDITLGAMSTIFLGNPMSTLSGFIAQTRIALFGSGNSYLYRARDMNGDWYSTCDDECTLRLSRGQMWNPHQKFS